MITFDSAGSGSFGNYFARNVIIFGVDNSSLSHSDNRKNNFLIFGEDPYYGITGNFGSPEKKLSIDFTKAKTTFCLSWHYSDNNCYLFVNGKKMFKFKTDNKNVKFPTKFCLGSISNGLSPKKYLKMEMCMIFQSITIIDIDKSDIDKSDILNIHKYLIAKNNTK